MNVKKFKEAGICKESKINYWDEDGVRINDKASLDSYNVVSTTRNLDGTVDVDVEYIEKHYE